ncbi:MAG: hypothetical protein ACJAZ1_002990 [Yoonia sp.]|jgi:hypothetical protein
MHVLKRFGDPYLEWQPCIMRMARRRLSRYFEYLVTLVCPRYRLSRHSIKLNPPI